MAEGFLQHYENKALETANIHNIDIKSYLRYVDDSHCRVPSISDANKFLEILNEQSPHLKYTIDVEDENKTLNFLDVKVINNKKR